MDSLAGEFGDRDIVRLVDLVVDRASVADQASLAAT